MKNGYHTVCFMLLLLSAAFASVGFCGGDGADEQKLIKVQEMYLQYKKDFPAIKDIMPSEAMEMMKKGHVVFVDTREKAEMDVSMLPGAVTKDEFLKQFSQYKTDTIIVYCTIGYRSGKFVAEMDEKGMSVLNLRGGILEWVLAGGKVYDKKGETRRVHVYGRKWNYLPKGYEPVMFGIFFK